MTAGPVVGAQYVGGGITIRGTPLVSPPTPGHVQGYKQPLPQFSPNTTPTPSPQHMIPIQPLPGTGGGGGGGPVGYPIDSG
jgi:hypothetical protein